MTPVEESLIDRILEAARSKGLDQKTLADLAGIRAETISRAKKRGSMDVSTVTRLARAAGLELTLGSAGSPLKRPTLSDPRWGLAWSNPAISDEALIQNALLKGAFTAILEAAVQYGSDRVQSQWKSLCRSDEAPGAGTRAYVDRMLANIQIGLSRAAA